MPYNYKNRVLIYKQNQETALKNESLLPLARSGRDGVSLGEMVASYKTGQIFSLLTTYSHPVASYIITK